MATGNSVRVYEYPLGRVPTDLHAVYSARDGGRREVGQYPNGQWYVKHVTAGGELVTD